MAMIQPPMVRPTVRYLTNISMHLKKPSNPVHCRQTIEELKETAE